MTVETIRFLAMQAVEIGRVEFGVAGCNRVINIKDTFTLNESKTTT